MLHFSSSNNYQITICVNSLLVLSRVQLFCNPKDRSLPGSSVHSISQGRILEWVAISFSKGSSQSRGRTYISRIGKQIFYLLATREALCLQKAYIKAYSNFTKYLLTITWCLALRKVLATLLISSINQTHVGVMRRTQRPC